MFFQLLIPISHSVLRTSAQQLFNENLIVFLTVPWILNTGVNNFLINDEWIIRVLTKGQLPTQQLIHDNTKRPKINMKAVPFASYYLRRHVMRSPDYCRRPVSSLNL